jgi:hypothetical protein
LSSGDDVGVGKVDASLAEGMGRWRMMRESSLSMFAA